jgi:hypothetical protein
MRQANGDLVEKEILDLSFINKFTRSQIEAEIKRQEKIFPIILNTQNKNVAELNDEKEELERQLKMNPNLFQIPNFDSKIMNTNYQTRTSSPVVMVQAPVFINSTPKQKSSNMDHMRGFHAEPHIYQRNMSNSAQDLNINNVIIK